MGTETQFVLRNNSSPALNLCNQASYVLPKHNGRMGIGQAFPLQKGEIRKKEGGDRSQASLKPSNQTSPALKAQEESSLVWYSALQAHWGGSPLALDRGPIFDSLLSQVLSPSFWEALSPQFCRTIPPLSLSHLFLFLIIIALLEDLNQTRDHQIIVSSQEPFNQAVS